MRSSHQRIEGFTLIELLVVISIIALLIAILLPALSAARQQTRTVLCSSNLRTLTQGWHLYANDYDGYFPLGAAYNSSSFPSQYHYHFWWRYDTGIAQYMPTPILRSAAGTPAGKRPTAETVYRGWFCAEHEQEAIASVFVGYTVNADLAYYKWTRIANIRSATRTPVLFDFWDVTASPTKRLGNYFVTPWHSNTGAVGYHFNEGTDNPHKNGGNFSFADGHVAMIPTMNTRQEYKDNLSWKP